MQLTTTYFFASNQILAVIKGDFAEIDDARKIAVASVEYNPTLSPFCIGYEISDTSMSVLTEWQKPSV